MPADHRVLAVWIRREPGGPMQSVGSLDVVGGAGIVGDHTLGRLRHVTIVFDDDWREAAATLGREVDPVGRRANVLVSGGGGARFVGTKIRVGTVRVDVKGIIAPCPVMDEAAPGMREALKPRGRSGLWGRALTNGTIAPGDELDAEPAVGAP